MRQRTFLPLDLHQEGSINLERHLRDFGLRVLAVPTNSGHGSSRDGPEVDLIGLRPASSTISHKLV